MSPIMFVAIWIMVFATSWWCYWSRKASREHLQMRNGTHHLNMQLEIIATRRKLALLEMEQDKESAH